MNKTLKKFLVVFAVIFSIPLVVWIFLFSNHLNRLNIVNNGTKTLATVTNYYSNVEVNGEPLYVIEFEYADESGNIHHGKTSAKYSAFQVENIVNGSRQILICYDKNFNAIEADYASQGRTELIVLPLVSIVGIGFWIALIFIKKREKFEKNARELGRETTAVYVGSGSGVEVNGVPLFFIQFSYKNDSGDTLTAKTHSKYSFEEVEYFRVMKKFKIKIYREKPVITEKIDLSKLYDKYYSKIDGSNELLQSKKSGLEFKKCCYCDSVLSVQDKKCPNCGSTKFTDYER